jgi:two-component system OmpR family response regulator
MRILIIEEEEQLNKSLYDTLLAENYQVDTVQTIPDAKYYVEIRNYDLVILDWSKKNKNFIEFVPTIKTENYKTSLIVISDREDRMSEIEALKSGADDFIKKPIDLEILLVRIEAKLRFGISNIIEIDELIINPEEEKIIYQGEEIELKGKPFEVLTHLAINKDQIVSKEQLLDAIWEEPELVTPNVIEVAINQIRQKMDKPLNITTIETVRRRGYRFCFPKEIS